jgi:hypothetical protein
MTHVWSQAFGDTGHQHGSSVASDASGNLVTTGYFMSSTDFGGGPVTSAGEYDVFVAKHDPDGNHLWSMAFGDLNWDQWGIEIATDSAGNVIVVGAFDGSVDFGGGLHTSAGD